VTSSTFAGPACERLTLLERRTDETPHRTRTVDLLDRNPAGGILRNFPRRDRPEFFGKGPLLRAAIRRRRNMTEVFFNCSSPGHILRDRRGLAVSDLSEAYAEAKGFVRSLLMTPTAEDWRGWELRVTDELGCEIFAIPFASVLGKAH
jgi:hypothetical protein